MTETEHDMPLSPFGPLLAEVARMRKSNLNAAIQDVDAIIDLLTAAREQVAGGTGNPPTPSDPASPTLPLPSFSKIHGAQDETIG